MKLTQKRQNKIRDYERCRPQVNEYRFYKKEFVDTSQHNFEFIANKMLSEPGRCGFQSRFDGDVYFFYTAEETEEKFFERVSNERSDLEKFERDFEEFKKQIYQEQAAEDELKNKENEKYSDPEYLEYLKLKKKFEV